MAFEGFELSHIDLGEVTVRVRHGGKGPPLLLLHGYPQTHMMWGAIAGELAKDFTVIAPDLRGYGESTQPATRPDHETYSKRAMGRDAIALMKHFGFARFNLAGHDRGGRVSYRLALDHPEVLERVAILDIVPTAVVWGKLNKASSLGYWHWSFLAQPAPFPEALIAADPKLFLDRILESTGVLVDPEAYADYLRAAAKPGVIHATCEDYRAGASYDLRLDREDHGKRKITVPTLVLWGAKGAVGHWYGDPLAVWAEWAEDLRGQAIDSGHFIPEEKPAETLAALRAFFLEGR